MRYVIAMSVLMGLLAVPFTPWEKAYAASKKESVM